jgi:hypothetical protein
MPGVGEDYFDVSDGKWAHIDTGVDTNFPDVNKYKSLIKQCRQ